MSAGGSGRYVSSPVALNFCFAKVAEHVIVCADFCAFRAESEKGSACLVALSGTAPLVSTLPLTEIVTSRVPGPRVIGTALEISEKVMGVSMRMATGDVEEDCVASSGRYGRIAGAHRRARRGEEDVAGIGKRPP